jgi:hypothetical protein
VRVDRRPREDTLHTHTAVLSRFGEVAVTACADQTPYPLAGLGARCDVLGMPPSTEGPPFDQFLAAAEAVAQARPEVDREMARDVFREAATLLHDGLALDGLDEHDARAAVAGLCLDLVAEDPGTAVRARSRAVLEDSEDLHDPEAVSAAYLAAASVLQL